MSRSNDAVQSFRIAQCTGGMSRRFFSRLFRRRQQPHSRTTSNVLSEVVDREHQEIPISLSVPASVDDALTSTSEEIVSQPLPLVRTNAYDATACHSYSCPEPGETKESIQQTTLLEAFSTQNANAANVGAASGCVPTETSAPLEDCSPLAPQSFVYVWGDNSKNQTLTPSKGIVETPICLERLARHSMAFVHCGPMSTWIVSEAGDLWAGGWNTKESIDPGSGTLIKQPKHIEDFEAMCIKAVASGDEHSVVLLTSGVPFSYGSNEFGQLGHGLSTETLHPTGPKRMFGLKALVSQLSCGASHTLVLTTAGQVFACGNGGDGSLGMGDGVFDSSPMLQPVPSLVGMPIQQIAAGRDHSMALSLSGKVYSWGRNRNGKLGLGPDTGSVVGAPQCVSFPDLPPFKYIATGATHTLAIGPKGRLYGCGDNSEGQLGCNPWLKRKSTVFEAIEVGSDVKIRLAACGGNHSVVITHQGRLIAFGRSKEGQLGVLGASQHLSIWKPSYITIEKKDKTESLYFYGISAGQDHTIALAVKLKGTEETVEQLGKEIMTRNSSVKPSQCFERTYRPTLFWDARNVPAADHQITNATTALPSTETIKFERLPSVVSRVAQHRYPALSTIQTLLSNKSIDSSVDAPPATQHKATSDRPTGRDLEPTAPYTRDEELYGDLLMSDDRALPAGCSSDELLHRLEAIKTSGFPDLALRLFKRRLTSIFVRRFVFKRCCTVVFSAVKNLCAFLSNLQSDPHRLNCSFLLPGRSVLLDAEGLDAVFSRIERLDASARDLIFGDLYEAMLTCLDALMPYAPLFSDVDQIRCFGLILQSWNLSLSSYLSTSVMKSVVKAVFALPYSGRRALTDLFRSQYPADIFGRRVVHNVKMFVNKMIAQETQYRTSVPLWQGVILLQLLYLASTEWALQQRSQAVDFSSRVCLEGKISPNQFCVEAANNLLDLASELRLFRWYITANGATRSCQKEPLCEDQMLATSALFLADVSVAFPQLRENRTLLQIFNSLLPEGFETDGPHELLGYRGPVFYPEDALRVTSLKQWWTYFLVHRNLCSASYKQSMVVLEATTCQKRLSLRVPQEPFYRLFVDRGRLLTDAWDGIMCRPVWVVLKYMEIVFRGEEGVDAGGLRREFFRLAIELLFHANYGRFLYKKETRTYWFKLDAQENATRDYFFVGVLLGLALHNGVLLSLQLPLVVYKKLQGERIGLDDMADIFPAEGNSLAQIYDWPKSQEKQFDKAFEGFCFEVQKKTDCQSLTDVVPLKPNGSNIKLTYATRQEYVTLYVKYLLETSIEPFFCAFNKGFWQFQTLLTKSLSGRELQLVLCGSPTVDFEDLRKGTSYEGYSASDDYIQSFWDTLFNFDVDQRRKFLIFCTGSDRVPLGGLRELALKVQKNGVEPTDRVPTSYTCFNTVLLPHYASQKKLQRLLTIAVEQNQGFGLR